MLRKLSSLEYGASGIIREIQSDKDKLACMGIRVGKNLRMVTRQPIKGPVVVLCGKDDVEIAMGLEIADEILVEITGESLQ